MLNQQNVSIKNGSNWEKVCPFPVGFIYLSQKSTSPATTFGGTWSVLNEDRFLRPSNAWTTGGSKKISIDQMPSHQHPRRVTTWASGFGGSGLACSNADSDYLSNSNMNSPGESVGGQGLLASIPRLLWVVQNCIILTKSVPNCLVSTSWMEVNANDYIG